METFIVLKCITRDFVEWNQNRVLGICFMRFVSVFFWCVTVMNDFYLFLLDALHIKLEISVITKSNIM